MLHALFDLESEPDPHPNKKLHVETVCPCMAETFTVLLNVGEIIFGHGNFIIYSALSIFGIEDFNTN